MIASKRHLLPHLEKLPGDIICVILSFLSVRDYLNLSVCSKSFVFSKYANDDRLWTPHIEQWMQRYKIQLLPDATLNGNTQIKSRFVETLNHYVTQYMKQQSSEVLARVQKRIVEEEELFHCNSKFLGVSKIEQLLPFKNKFLAPKKPKKSSKKKVSIVKQPQKLKQDEVVIRAAAPQSSAQHQNNSSNRHQPAAQPMSSYAIIGVDSTLSLLGDFTFIIGGTAKSGKTSLAIRHTTSVFPCEDPPGTVPVAAVGTSVPFDTSAIRYTLRDVNIPDQQVMNNFHEFHRCDVLLLCFSVVSSDSYQDMLNYWSVNLRHAQVSAPILLVGTKTDLRSDYNYWKKAMLERKRIITREEGESLAKLMNAMAYVECSSFTNTNVKQVFETAIRLALLKKREEAASVNKNCIIC